MGQWLIINAHTCIGVHVKTLYRSAKQRILRAAATYRRPCVRVVSSPDPSAGGGRVSARALEGSGDETSVRAPPAGGVAWCCCNARDRKKRVTHGSVKTW